MKWTCAQFCTMKKKEIFLNVWFFSFFFDSFFFLVKKSKLKEKKTSNYDIKRQRQSLNWDFKRSFSYIIKILLTFPHLFFPLSWLLSIIWSQVYSTFNFDCLRETSTSKTLKMKINFFHRLKNVLFAKQYSMKCFSFSIHASNAKNLQYQIFNTFPRMTCAVATKIVRIMLRKLHGSFRLSFWINDCTRRIDII